MKRKDSILLKYYNNKLPKHQMTGQVDYKKRQEENLQKSLGFLKDWYTKRATLPQFKDVSEKRLQVLEQPVETKYLDPQTMNALQFAGAYNPRKKILTIADPNSSFGDFPEYEKFMQYSTGSPLFTHELFHRLQYEAPQFTKVVPKKITEKIRNYPELTSPDYISLSTGKRKTGFGKASKFYPEMEAITGMLRQAEAIDPLKPVTSDDVSSYIKKYDEYKRDIRMRDVDVNQAEEFHRGRLIKQLFDVLGNDPEKIAAYLNSVAKADNQQDLSLAKWGGLTKYQSKGQVNNSDQPYLPYRVDYTDPRTGKPTSKFYESAEDADYFLNNGALKIVGPQGVQGYYEKPPRKKEVQISPEEQARLSKQKAVEDTTKSFLEKWYNSPMHREMLKSSLNRGLGLFLNKRTDKMIQDRLKTIPDIKVNVDKLPEGVFNINDTNLEGFVNKDNPSLININAFSTIEDAEGTGVHEGSHLADYATGIPIKDVKRMRRAASFPTDEYGQYIIGDKSGTEPKARIYGGRYELEKAGIYNPFTQKLSKENFEKGEREVPEFKRINDELRSIYSTDDIFNFYNTISKSNNTQPQTMARYGFSLQSKQKGLPKHQSLGEVTGKNCKGQCWKPTLNDKSGNSGGMFVGNTPISWSELLKYNEVNTKDKQFKNYLKDLQSKFPGLTKEQLLAAGADSSRIRGRVEDLPTWDKPENQTYDRAWYPFYRSLMQPNTRVTIPQILEFQSQQPGGLGGYQQVVESNYGKKKFRDGGNTELGPGDGKKQLPPIYVNDPNDPRLRAYNDSLDAYNDGEYLYKFGKGIYDLVRSPINKEFRINHNIRKINYPAHPYRDTNIYPIETYDEQYDLKPASWKQKLLGDDRQDYYIDTNGKAYRTPGTGWQKYKKPVQSYILQQNFKPNKTTSLKHFIENIEKPESTLKKQVLNVQPIHSSLNYTPQINTIQHPNIELPDVQRGKYRANYWDPEMKDWNERAFMSQEESDRFAQEMSQRGYPGSYGNVTQRVKYANGGDISIPDLNADKWLTKYQSKGQVNFSLPNARDIARGMMNKTDAPLTIQEKLRKEAEANEINKRNKATAKRQFVGPARATTIDDERNRIAMNKAYAASHPYTSIDEQGNLSRAQWDRNMEGVADKYTTAAGVDKGMEHFANALEAAGYAEGLGYLGKAGYNALRSRLAESMESGLLSNTYKLNPWRFKANPEAYYRGIGRSGLDDALESQVLRTANKTGNYGEDLYMTPDFKIAKGNYSIDQPTYKGDPFGEGDDWEKILPKDSKSYIAEIPKSSLTNARGIGSNVVINKGSIPINNVKLLKQDWLRGYKPTQQKKQGGVINTYGPGGATTDGCPAGYNKHPLTGECIPNGWVAPMQAGPTVQNAERLRKAAALNRGTTGPTIGESHSDEPWRQRQAAEIRRQNAQQNSALAQTMGSFTPSGYNPAAGVIGANTQLIATAVPVVASAIGAAAPYVAPALKAPLLGTLGASYGTGAITAGNLINAGFAYHSAKNLPNVTAAWRDMANKPTLSGVGNALGQTALSTLDMLPFASTAFKGVPGVVKGMESFKNIPTAIKNKIFNERTARAAYWLYTNPIEKLPAGPIKEHLQGIAHGIADISNPLIKRPFFETFPITKSQKLKIAKLQDKASLEHENFIKDWFYGKGNELRPEVEERILKLYPELKGWQTKNMDLTDFDNPISTLKNRSVSSRSFSLLNNKSISPYAIHNIYNNRSEQAGVNIRATNEAIALRNKGLYYYRPSVFGTTAGHEIAHSTQNLGFSKPTNPVVGKNYSWLNNIESETPDKLYYEANPNTEMGKVFKEAMVEATPGVYKWEASPGELHADIMPARKSIYNYFIKDLGYSPEKAMSRLQNLSDRDAELLLNYADADKFFKPETPLQTKIDIIKMLPATLPIIGGAAVLSQNKEYGGPLQAYYQDKMTGPNIFANGGQANEYFYNKGYGVPRFDEGGQDSCDPGYYYDVTAGKCLPLKATNLPLNEINDDGTTTSIEQTSEEKRLALGLGSDAPPNESLKQGIAGSDAFLKNWYTQRTDDPRYGKVAQQRIGEIPKIQETPTNAADLQKKEAGAYYIYGGKKIYIDPNNPYSRGSSVQTHEKTHEVYDQVPQPNQDAIIKSLIVDEKNWKGGRTPKHGYKYFSNPTEVAARLNQFRKRYNIDPNKKYTPEEMKAIIDAHKNRYSSGVYIDDMGIDINSGDENIDQLFDIIGNDPAKLAELNDRIVMNQQTTGADMAKWGGLVKYQKKGEVKKKSPITHYVFAELDPGDPFGKEAANLKTYISNNYPGENVVILPGRGDEYFNNTVLPTLEKVGKQDRVYLFGHHGSKYAGVPASLWGNAFEKAQQRAGDFNCYLGSCGSSDLAGSLPERDIKYIDPAFSRLKNFYYRPELKAGEADVWLGVNPNAEAFPDASNIGVLNAMYTRSQYNPEFNKLYKIITQYKNNFYDNDKQLQSLYKQFDKLYGRYDTLDTKGKDLLEKVKKDIYNREVVINSLLNKDKKYRTLNQQFEIAQKPYITKSPRYGIDFQKSTFNPYINIDQRQEHLKKKDYSYYDSNYLSNLFPSFKQGGMIEDDMGQLKYPGFPTRIRSKNITMEGVNHPLVAKTNRGITKLLLPNMKYEFEPMTQFVDEHPVPMIPQISNQTPRVMRNFGGEEPARYINLSLPKMDQKRKKVEINPYIYYERPNPFVNVMGAGFQGNARLNNRWDLTGGMNVGKVSIPTENFSQYLKPNYNIGLGYRFSKGGQHGGLDRWFAEKWVDVKTGKTCGRQEGENRAYPACRPSKRISSQTPKTSSEMSSSEKAKFKSVKQSSQRIPYNHKRR